MFLCYVFYVCMYMSFMSVHSMTHITLVVLMVSMLLLVHLMEHYLCGRPSLEFTGIPSNTGNYNGQVCMYCPFVSGMLHSVCVLLVVVL